MNLKSFLSPLGVRISLAVILVVVPGGVVANGFLTASLSRDIAKQFEERGRTLSLLLARLVSEGIAEENLDLVNRAATILEAPGVEYIVIYTEFWDLIETYPPHHSHSHRIEAAREHFAAHPESRFFVSGDLGHGMYDFYARVYYQPFLDAPPLEAGFVEIDISAQVLAAARAKVFRLHFWGGVIFSVLVVTLLLVMLHLLVVRPVRRLKSEIELFGRKGVLPAAGSTDDDEIGELARQFEEMAAIIAKRSRELERSNQELTQFAYVTSHDLQEPLRVITGFVQLLEQRCAAALDRDGREYMEFIVDAAGRMKGLINDLLAYSRLTTKARSLETVDLNVTLAEVEENLRLVIAETGARIVCEQPLPTVWAERSQMGQLLQNLIGNALRYQREGAVPRIRLSCRRQGEEWLVAVEDNGIGIEERYFERIFKIFQRLHNNDEYPGTGIGLAICKKIVECHQGRIWVESTPGQGSTFYFTLPAAGVAAEQ